MLLDVKLGLDKIKSEEYVNMAREYQQWYLG